MKLPLVPVPPELNDKRANPVRILGYIVKPAL
jgi:hypothetical protein